MARLHALFLCLALFPACGSSDDDDGEPGTNGAGPTCGADEFALEGELDGEAVSHSGTLRSHAWIQGSTPSTLDVGFEGGGSVDIEWAGVVARGETIAVTGSITLPVSGPRAGETFEVGSGAMTALEDGATFELGRLSAEVQCIQPLCPADQLDGTLRGCVNWDGTAP